MEVRPDEPELVLQCFDPSFAFYEHMAISVMPIVNTFTQEVVYISFLQWVQSQLISKTVKNFEKRWKRNMGGKRIYPILQSVLEHLAIECEIFEAGCPTIYPTSTG